MKAKNVIPEKLLELSSCTALGDLVERISAFSDGTYLADQIVCSNGYAKFVDGYEMQPAGRSGEWEDKLIFHQGLKTGDCKMVLVWFDPFGEPWELTVRFIEADVVPDLEFSSWKKTNRLLLCGFLPNAVNILNSEDELEMLLLSLYPQCYSYMLSKKFHSARNTKEYCNQIFSAYNLLIAPQIRVMEEEGVVAFALDDGNRPCYPKDYRAIAKFTRPGSTLDEIVIPKLSESGLSKFCGAGHPAHWYSICRNDSR